MFFAKSLSLRYKNNILNLSQYRFITNSLPELAITTFYDKLLDNLNNKKVTSSILLDLKKAFDSASDNILLRNLNIMDFVVQFGTCYIHIYMTEKFAQLTIIFLDFSL